jgi:hypothetical protein
MVYIIKQVGKDLYFHCVAGGCSFVEFGKASITRKQLTVQSTLDHLKKSEEKRRKDHPNTDLIEFEVLSFTEKDIKEFLKSIGGYRNDIR